MSIDAQGIGGRKPLLDINVNRINLDPQNPRLVPYLKEDEEPDQFRLIQILYDHFDSQVVGLSLVQNGYFDEEPIIVVPDKLPDGFNYDKFTGPDELAAEYQVLIDETDITFTVVEGNRRVSAIKLITDKGILENTDLQEPFPTSDDKATISDISNIPCIIYRRREDVFTYLGIRHIAGNLRWEAFAQASYTANMIEYYIHSEGLDAKEAITKVQKVVAHRSDKLIKQYVAYKLYEQAVDDLEFDTRPLINRFSLLTLAYNTSSIREYIGVPKYKQIDFASDLVASENLEKFRNLLVWIYGDKEQKKNPVITDSRVITKELSHIVKSEEAIEYLLKTEDVEGAYDRTSGEEEYLIKKVESAYRSIQTSLKFAYKYKHNEKLKKDVRELQEIITALAENLK